MVPFGHEPHGQQRGHAAAFQPTFKRARASHAKVSSRLLDLGCFLGVTEPTPA